MRPEHAHLVRRQTRQLGRRGGEVRDRTGVAGSRCGADVREVGHRLKGLADPEVLALAAAEGRSSSPVTAETSRR